MRNADRVRYTFFGVCFGLSFPLISTLIDLHVRNLDFTFVNLRTVQEEQPLHWIINTAPFFLGIFAFFIGVKQENVRRANTKLLKVLENTLPREVATEILKKGFVTPKYYEHVTVMFVDIKGFTLMAAETSPKQVVKDLDTYFSMFDEIVAKYNVEKIKTIGDAFMAAGGLPVPGRTNTTEVVQAGIEIRNQTVALNEQRRKNGERTYDVRVGIHAGPVVAGVVGKNRLAYDVWGDTVNTAARIQSNGEVLKVNISETIFNLVRYDFNCNFNGQIEAKGKGLLNFYTAESKDRAIIGFAPKQSIPKHA